MEWAYIAGGTVAVIAVVVLYRKADRWLFGNKDKE